MLEFNPETHEYILDGKKVISVTQLLTKHGLSPDYSFVKEDVLNKASDKGRMIHEEIEEYLKTGTIGFTPQLAFFMDEIHGEYKAWESEVMVCYKDMYAGTLDLLCKNTKGQWCIIDIKTTSKLDKASVAWQTTLYAKAIEDMRGIKVRALYALHLSDASDYKLVKIDRIADEAVDKLLEDEASGRTEITLPPALVAEVESLESYVAFLKQQQEAVNKKMAEFKAELKKAMIAAGIKSFKTDKFSVLIKDAYTRSSVDSKRLKAEMPEVYDKYLKTTQVGESMTLEYL